VLVASSTTFGAETGDWALLAVAGNKLMHIKVDRMNLGTGGIGKSKLSLAM
jgi:hypothetical protein